MSLVARRTLSRCLPRSPCDSRLDSASTETRPQAPRPGQSFQPSRDAATQPLFARCRCCLGQDGWRKARPGSFAAVELWRAPGDLCSALLRSSGSFGGDSVARGFGTVAPLGARENEAQPWPKPGPTADGGASQQRCIPRTRGLRGARGRGVVRGDPRAELVVEHGSFLLSRRSPTGSASPSRPELPSRGLPVQHAAGGSFKDRCTALL